MKTRKYFNCYEGGRTEAAETIGYPLSLPNLEGIEFAIVRPVDWGATMARRGWQVIHVRTGKRVMYRKENEANTAAARESAMAEIERAGKKFGWDKLVRKLKRAKTPCIVAALKALQ